MLVPLLSDPLTRQHALEPSVEQPAVAIAAALLGTLSHAGSLESREIVWKILVVHGKICYHRGRRVAG